jgi:hypothetical protein
VYDIIGDIHGERRSLEALLRTLGYGNGLSGWHHPERKAIFLGDLIDRGHDSPGVVALVRDMCENDHALAIMGNHEINALGFHTRHPDTGDFLRPRTPSKVRQHQTTLEQYRGSDAELVDALQWFQTLPLWLDLGALRAVHAAWHPPAMARLAPLLDSRNAIAGPAALVPLQQPHTAAYQAMDVLLKGIELPLPDGVDFVDKEGTRRREARIKWWDADASRPWPDLAIDGERLTRQGLTAAPLLETAFAYPREAPPVFFGHYWLSGTPAPLAPNVACLDYSVARAGGSLAAYRWDGEETLRGDRFVTVARVR